MNAPPSGGPFGGSGTWLWPVACIGYSPCHSSGSHSLPYALSYKHRKTSAVVRGPRRALWLSLVVRRQTRRSLWCEPCGVSRLLHALAFHDVDIRQTGWRQIKGEVLYFHPLPSLTSIGVQKPPTGEPCGDVCSHDPDDHLTAPSLSHCVATITKSCFHPCLILSSRRALTAPWPPWIPVGVTSTA